MHEKDERNFHDLGERDCGQTVAHWAQKTTSLDLLSEASRIVQNDEIEIISGSLTALRALASWLRVLD